jgi:hypothetical protein
MLLKNTPHPPWSGKFIFTKMFCLFYIISTQTIYIYTENSWNERICEIESRFKIVYLFIYTLQ